MFLVADDAVVVVKLSSFLCFSWFIWTSSLCLRRRRFMHWAFQRQDQSDYESKDHELSNYGRCRHHGRLYICPSFVGSSSTSCRFRTLSHIVKLKLSEINVHSMSRWRSSTHIPRWMTIQSGGVNDVEFVMRSIRRWSGEWSGHSCSSDTVGGDHLSFGGGVWGEESNFPLRRSAGEWETCFTPVEECASKESASVKVRDQ